MGECCWADRVLQQSHDAVVGVDSLGHITYVNEAAAQMFRYSRSELLGRPLALLLPPLSASSHAGLVDRFLRSDQPSRSMSESRAIVGVRSDGSLIELNGSVTRVEGRVDLRALAVLTDLTPLRRSEATAKHLEFALDLSDVMVVGLDSQKRITFANRSFIARWSLAPDVDRLPIAQIDPRLGEVADRAVGGAILQNSWTDRIDLDVTGEHRWFDVFAAVSRPTEGAPVVVLCLRDVTSRRRTRSRMRSGALALDVAQEMGGIGYWQWTADEPGVVELSPSLQRLLGEPRGSTSLRSLLDLLPKADRLQLFRELQRSARTRHQTTTRHRIQLSDGDRYVTQSVVVDERAGVLLMVGVVRDDTDHVRSLRESQASGHLLEAAINSMSALCAIVDREGVVIATNRSWKDSATDRGAASGCGLGSNYLALVARAADEGVPGAVEGLRVVGSVVCGASPRASIDYQFIEQDGTVRWFMLTAEAIAEFGGAIVSHRDITARKRAEQALREQATQDPLTGLANRAGIQRALEVALDGDQPFVVAVIDLDDFKSINDSYGHLAGDHALCAAADRLRSVTRPGDELGRFGGDEFVLVVNGVASRTHLRQLGQRLIEAFRSPLRVAGVDLRLHASIGLTLVTADSQRRRAGEVLKAADSAMYAAKRLGGNTFEDHGTSDRPTSAGRLAMEDHLRRDLLAGRLGVHYQPLYSVDERTICSFEALARWANPEHGSVPASVFVPIAESSGLISLLGAHVLGRACWQLAEWDRVGLTRRETMSVNISLRELASDEIVETVLR